MKAVSNDPTKPKATGKTAIKRDALHEGMVDADPSAGLLFKKSKMRAKDKRLPFDSADLKAIFGAPLFTGCIDDASGYSKPGPNIVRRGRFCCITGTEENVQYHSEDYYAPWNAYPIARDVHMKLHQRFKSPAAWDKIVTEHAQTGDEWFARLSMAPIDLAAQLRVQHGDEIRNVFDRAELIFADRNAKACFASPRLG